MDALEDILDECADAGKKVVVFARFVPEIDAIERLLKKRKTEYALIHGGITDRSEQVERFQNVSLIKMLGAEIADDLREVFKADKPQEGEVKPIYRMPIRAAPYSHQITAFNFAL